MPSASNNDILSPRLVAHGLHQPAFSDPADVVSRLCAVQSQEYLSALWAIGMRMRHAHPEAIERAADEGRILRTHVLRPTWHFVAAADIRWMLSLTSAHVHRLCAAGYRELELDAATLRKARRVIVAALDGAEARTRADLGAALTRSGIPAAGRRLNYLVMHEELDGIICSGPRRGRQSTYALLERRAPGARALPRDEALPLLLRRYLEGHAPATLHDFAWWSGLTLTDARRALAALDRDVEVRGEGRLWLPGRDVGRRGAPRAWLLPNFDEWFVGYRDRSAAAGDTPPLEALVSSVVIDGRRTGTWRRTITARSIAIDVTLARAISEAEHRATARAATALGDFLGLGVRLTVTAPPPQARPRRSPPGASRATSR